ncbi:oxidoreductase-like protein [Boeremia exigua]|uniref:oxidoreductase-like protein n=1 Tax=Boeremia exigua TaxID=749465 RepID=UPI001E8E0F99|nr:oxidoreductase-like protein [Boeremia exigua]KAH6638385.1 oxidoreductase-like protein [Boeremia exigua]
MDPITFSTIGTSWITYLFIKAAHVTGQWRLTAAYSRNFHTLQELISQHGGAVHGHTKLNDLVNDPNATTIYIASPNILHYEHARLALQAGKNVVIEKPFCSTVEELDELYTIAERMGLGHLNGATISLNQRSTECEAVLASDVPNVLNLKMGGGALVIDLFGLPTKTEFWPTIIKTGVDGVGHLVLQYNGFIVQIHYKIFGEYGTLVLSSITDIGSVKFCDSRTKGVEELARPRGSTHFNLEDEALEFARLLQGRDAKALKKYETLSRCVLAIMCEARHAKGIVFPEGK